MYRQIITFAFAAGLAWICRLDDQVALGADSYASAVLADRPIAYYRFNETAGSVAVDETGNGHDGTYKGGIELGQPSAYAALGRAVAFDGKDARVQIPANKAFQFGTGDFSVEFWFNCRETLSTRGDVFTYKGDGKDFGLFKPVGNSNLIAISRPFRPFQSQTDPFSIGAWHHAVFVRRGGVDHWYLDGALSGTATRNGLAIDMNVDLLIGGNHLGDANETDANCAWNGWIDELAIYPMALDDEQVAAHVRLAKQAELSKQESP